MLLWNYHDDDVPGPVVRVRVELAGAKDGRALLRHYRIDETHSNAWTAWKMIGSPQHPTPEQYAALESSGQLEELGSPRWVTVKSGKASIEVMLPRQAVSLLQLTW
jgi:xylan 1,4-beta-xylosidase